MYSTGGPNIFDSLNESKLNFVGKFLPTILELYHWNGYLSLLFLPIPTYPENNIFRKGRFLREVKDFDNKVFPLTHLALCFNHT